MAIDLSNKQSRWDCPYCEGDVNFVDPNIYGADIEDGAFFQCDCCGQKWEYEIPDYLKRIIEEYRQEEE
jgi:transcription elongation factor Elf1